MYHGNIFAFLLSIFTPKARLFWNIRTCIDDFDSFSATLKFIWRLNLLTSRFVEKCVFNSSRSLVQHSTIGFKASSNIIIPNGFDCNLWRRLKAARFIGRKKFTYLHLNLSSDLLVVVITEKILALLSKLSIFFVAILLMPVLFALVAISLISYLRVRI